MPLSQEDAKKLIDRRHPTWVEFQLTWRWLLDSYEGGQRYRSATYGSDWHGLPIRNLIRHKREVPDEGTASAAGGAIYPAGLAIGGAAGPLGSLSRYPDSYTYANDSDYELRRARTPVPTFLREAVETHLSKIFTQEISHDGPPQLEEWWADVDGRGTPIGTWVEQEVAPLLFVLGQIDILVDHPPPPDGVQVSTRADQSRYGLDRAVASYILPENMTWYRRDLAGRYVECIVREYSDEPAEGEAAERYRHWTATDSTLYDLDGKLLWYVPHRFGRVPIERHYDRRKPRVPDVGQPRYEAIAERQREYYNRDSELVLSDANQAHAILQGPEEWCNADSKIPLGPSNLLPMKKNGSGDHAHYQGFEVIEFPKGSADSLRLNKHDIREDVDRDAKLVKPAGITGSTKGVVAQSGVSKMMDHKTGNELLTELVEALGRMETVVAELVLTVLKDGPPDTATVGAINVVYPTSFALRTADEMAQGLTDFQSLLATSGECPQLETLWLQNIFRENIKGEDQATYKAIDKEIDLAVQSKAKLVEQRAEGAFLLPGGERFIPAELLPPGTLGTPAEGEPSVAPNYNPSPTATGGY